VDEVIWIKVVRVEKEKCRRQIRNGVEDGKGEERDTSRRRVSTTEKECQRSQVW
jgi:hypothetical protein